MARNRTCLIISVVLLIAGAAGIVIWQFLPSDTKDDIQNTIFGDNSTASGEGNGNGGGPFTTTTTTTPSTEAPWKFIQCQDVTTDCCNGLDVPGFCDKRVNEVLYGFLHNAMSSSDEGFLFFPNHEASLELAMEAGFRAFELDVGRCNGQVVFFHSQCVLGTRDPDVVLANINQFLDENPSEIISLSFQMTDQSVQLSELHQIMQTIPGFVDKLYVHDNPSAEWPTLGELVQSNQRILLFYFAQPNCQSQNCPAGFHFWFDHGMNTDFALSSLAEIQDSANSCQLSSASRATAQATAADTALFFRVNSFVSTPNADVSAAVNQPSFALQRIDDCSAQNNGRPVTFYSVDFWQQGNVPEMIQMYNRGLVDDSSSLSGGLQAAGLAGPETQAEDNSVSNIDGGAR